MSERNPPTPTPVWGEPFTTRPARGQTTPPRGEGGTRPTSLVYRTWNGHRPVEPGIRAPFMDSRVRAAIRSLPGGKGRPPRRGGGGAAGQTVVPLAFLRSGRARYN